MATSSVTNSATASLISSLGAGSGIDMQTLATNLAAAQFAGRSDRLTTKSDTLDKQISAASSLKSALSSFASALGDRVRQGDLSPQPQIGNPLVAKAALSGTSTPKGSFSLEVSSLASSQVLASPAYAAATSPVGSGDLKIRFGTIGSGTFTEDAAHAALDVSIASGATLADVASAINAKNAGVTAYVANTTAGAKLVLKGADGAANAFTIEATEAVGDPGLAGLAWDPATAAPDRLQKTASNAELKVDGLAISSASNSVTDAIPGVTLTLNSTNVGIPTTVSFSDPSSMITAAMSDITSALNEVGSQLRAATDPKTGDLARDSGALALKRKFSSLTNTIIMPGAAEGAPATLSDLGLSIQRDGSFSLDTARLAATLKANPDAASAMFTNGLYGVFSTIEGISRGASLSSDPGTLAGSISRMTAQKTQVSDDKAKLTLQQDALRAQLSARFAYADNQIGASKSTLSFLKNQIDAWNKSGS